MNNKMYLYKGANVISKKISKKNKHCSLIKVHLIFSMGTFNFIFAK